MSLIQSCFFFNFIMSSTFEDRKQEFLSSNGAVSGYDDHEIWAWLTNNDQSKASQISNIINNSWLINGWLAPNGAARLLLARALYQFPTRISSSDKTKIENQFHAMAYDDNGLDIFCCCTSNGAVTRKAAGYIYLQNHKDVNVVFPNITSNCGGEFYGKSYSYQGRTYLPGQSYNGYELCRDWLSVKFDEWVESGDWTGEFDSSPYTEPLLLALLLLHDLAQDPEMKRKAKMMLDLILLDTILSVANNNSSQGMYGGAYGRTYGNDVLSKNWPSTFWYPVWGLYRGNAGKYRWMDFCDIYVGSYSPGIIEDIGKLSDESDNYTHMHSEYHGYGGSRGAWNYVTRHYNLGGDPMFWMGNVLASDDPSGSGIRFWIDDLAQIPGPGADEYYVEIGKMGFQHKNAMLVAIPTPYLHFASPNRNDADGNTFDVDELDGGWRFFREDNEGNSVALALKMGANYQALEMCLSGLDYPDYNAFKSAVKANASLTGGVFTTSKGVKISREFVEEKWVTVVNGQRMFADGTLDQGQHADRLECVDGAGNRTVDWENKIMTLRKHGTTLVYNYNTWIYGNDSCTANPMLVLNTTDLDFGLSQSQHQFEIANPCAGSLTWQVSSNEAWVSSLQPAAGVNAGTVTVTVNRANLAEGYYYGAITVSSNIGAAYISTSIGKITAAEVYLSDMQPATEIVGWGSLGRDVSVLNTPITISGKTYPKGLGCHAFSELIYQLGGSFLNFSSEVGMDDAVCNGTNSSAFLVYLDGVKQFDSGVMKKFEPAKPVALSVAGVNELKLIVTDGGDGIGCDLGEWGNAKLTQQNAGTIDLIDGQGDLFLECFPNPFNSRISIRYKLNQTEKVQVAVYDHSGRMVEKIMDGEQSAERVHLKWNPNTSTSGVYLIQLKVGEKKFNRRVVFLK